MAARHKLAMSLWSSFGTSLPWRIPKLGDNERNRLDYEKSQLCSAVISNKDRSISSTFWI
jgi:hypothetical protein